MQTYFLSQQALFSYPQGRAWHVFRTSGKALIGLPLRRSLQRSVILLAQAHSTPSLRIFCRRTGSTHKYSGRNKAMPKRMIMPSTSLATFLPGIPLGERLNDRPLFPNHFFLNLRVSLSFHLFVGITEIQNSHYNIFFFQRKKIFQRRMMGHSTGAQKAGDTSCRCAQ